MVEQELVLLLGGDLGDPFSFLARAEEALEQRVGPIVSRSRDHWTEPWGFQAGTLFLNRALRMRSRLPPHAVLRECLDIEKALGRVRSVHAGPTSRTIDIDVLLVDAVMLSTPHLTLPHPRLHERSFALAPLADIWPQWLHPERGCTALDLLNALSPRP